MSFAVHGIRREHATTKELNVKIDTCACRSRHKRSREIRRFVLM